MRSEIRDRVTIMCQGESCMESNGIHGMLLLSLRRRSLLETATIDKNFQHLGNQLECLSYREERANV